MLCGGNICKLGLVDLNLAERGSQLLIEQQVSLRQRQLNLTLNGRSYLNLAQLILAEVSCGQRLTQRNRLNCHLLREQGLLLD